MTERLPQPGPEDDYGWVSTEAAGSCTYLAPAVNAALETFLPAALPRRFVDIGCGNGAFLHWMAERGWDGVGIEPSTDGCRLARQAGVPVIQGSVYDRGLLSTIGGPRPCAVSMEVVEHVYFPRLWAAFVREALLPGGVAVITTPYHGYLKNLALAISGRFDQHFHALWDHGHIKFFSIRTLTALVSEAGLEVLDTQRIGRIPPLAKSMLLVVRRPA